VKKLDFDSIFAAAPAPYLLLAPDADYTIVGVNDAYLCATMTTRESPVLHRHSREMSFVVPSE